MLIPEAPEAIFVAPGYSGSCVIVPDAVVPLLVTGAVDAAAAGASVAVVLVCCALLLLPEQPAMASAQTTARQSPDKRIRYLLK